LFLDGSELRIAATDLANHLACRRLTELDRLVAHGDLERPAWRDPMAAVLEERGLAHDSCCRCGFSCGRLALTCLGSGCHIHGRGAQAEVAPGVPGEIESSQAVLAGGRRDRFF